jgi:glycerophosphoryl diester phosphodiesterase
VTASPGTAHRLARVPGLLCPAIVAHRGASLRYPENTLAAFRAAVRAGADVIELDARLTADGVPVVMHDADVATTTDGSGLVHELTLAQVSALRVGALRVGRDPARRAGVPTLRHALAYLRGRATVEIDLKNEPGEPGFDGTHRVAAEALRLVRELRLGPVIVASANPETMEWVRRHHPDAVTGVEAGEGENLWDWIDYAAGQGHTFLMPDAAAVLSAGADFVTRAHAHGVQVDVWTVNDPETVSGLFSWGTDLVETDDPELAIPARNRARIAGPGA